jgi:hypothetical protein
MSRRVPEPSEFRTKHARMPLRVRVGLAILLAFTGAVLLGGLLTSLTSSPVPSGSFGVDPSHSGPAPMAGVATGTAPAAASPADETAGLQLGISASPEAICVQGSSSCSAGVGMSRVTLTSTPQGGGTAYPAVQVAFILETTNYDGAGCSDLCGLNGEYCVTINPADGFCEQGNGPQFLMYHAQAIADQIQADNPHTAVSFALIDGFATDDDLDDGDDAQYHVDTPNFIPVQDFGQVALQVKANLFHCNGGWTFCDSGMLDSFLHSDSITELYGAISGFGLNWSAGAHHVIVLMTSSSPRAEGFEENYGATYTLWGAGPGNYPDPYDPSLISSDCEPSYPFPSGPSPQCEGWVTSQDGNKTNSIAELTKTAKNCVDAIGGTCTVDVIDLWDCMTDPLCQGWWPNTMTSPPGGGPTWQNIIKQDVTHTLIAGCELAAATGGSWDGPAWFTCPDGQQGTLQFVPHGPLDNPNTNNPTLFDALTTISFGPVLNNQVATDNGVPIFIFMPYGDIAFAPNSSLDLQVTCLREGQPFKTCDPGHWYSTDGVPYLAWNFSDIDPLDVMEVGDYWSVSFNVVANGPPYGYVPVDACTTIFCSAAGSGPVGGVYTWANYDLCTQNLGCGEENGSDMPHGPPGSPLGVRGADEVTLPDIVESFPLAEIDVVPFAVASPPPGAFPPTFAPTPPSLPIISPSPVVVPQQIGLAQGSIVANISLNATAAGFLGAGFTTVVLKNRPIAMKMAAMAGKKGLNKSQFEGAEGFAFGRFE